MLLASTSSYPLDKLFQKALLDYNKSVDSVVIRQLTPPHSIDSTNSSTNESFIPTAPKECSASFLRRPSHRILIEKTDGQSESNSIQTNTTTLHNILKERINRIKSILTQEKTSRKDTSIRRMRDLVSTTTGASNLSVDGRILSALTGECQSDTHNHHETSIIPNPVTKEYERVICMQVENKRKRDVDSIGKTLILPGLVGTKIVNHHPLKGILLTTEYRDTFTRSRRNLLDAIRNATPTEYGVVKNDISVWRDVCISHCQCIYSPSTSMHCKPKKKK